MTVLSYDTNAPRGKEVGHDMSVSDMRRRIGEEHLPGAVFPYERILLTFADLPQAEEVFQLALHLAAGEGRSLYLLRVVPALERRLDAESLYSELRAINMLLQEEAIAADLEAAPAGNAETIIDYARERDVDLIIAVSRAANGGSYRRLVEDVLRQAPCTAMMLCAAARQVAERPAQPAASTGSGAAPSLVAQAAGAAVGV